MNIQLPPKKGAAPQDLEFNQLVIVGANGSGKTRFGSNIEERYNKITHRISAQKSLSMPVYVSTKSKDAAYSEFRFGGWDSNNPKWSEDYGWKHQRWGNNLNTFLLNDYEKLMTLLHTEEYEASLSYKEAGGNKPNTKLDRIQRIFEIVLPHRKLTKKAGIIEVYTSGASGSNYNASEMSDGERVIFYLVGEAVCAPENAIIIIDEPEMHIHKSLVKNLFDLIEQERTDCSFIYLTHDIDFAHTRQNAIKIWAKSYEGDNIWDYEILDEAMPIPEQLYLEVLGSRKPVIFLEGESCSIDCEIYEQVYLDYTLKPLGSCEKVIQSVKAFNEQKGFHNIESLGIIDRDRRPHSDLVKLNSKGIWVLDVAEAENLLLIENIVISIATHMGREPQELFNQVKQNLIAFFSSQLDTQILLHFKEQLRRNYISLTNFHAKSIPDVIVEIDGFYNLVDKQILYDSIKTEFENIVTTNDYDSVLRLFNLKNALIPNSKVCELTGVKNKEDYRKLVITLLKKNDSVSKIIREGIDNKIIKTLNKSKLPVKSGFSTSLTEN